LAELVIGVKNVYLNAAENVEVILRCNDPCFQLIDTIASLGNIASGEIATNQDQPFQFQVTSFENPHLVDMELEVHYNNTTDIVHFQLFAGLAEVLLVKDERDAMNSQRFYLDVLDSLGYNTHYWDIDVNGTPDSTFLKYFPAVVWYTGSDQGNTISEDNQNALIAYLNNGGRLFVTGQNISDEIGNTVFMNDYLHAGDGGNTNMYLVQGIAGDILSDGMFFHLNGGNSLNNQYSLSMINPVNGGTGCFKYGYGSSMAGIRFDDDIYRTVFLGFGFEGIDSTAHRYELMQRIMQYFDVYVGENKLSSTKNDLSEIKLMPNPASDRITINYTLSVQQDITIQVFDLAGREIITEKRMKEQSGDRILALSLGQIKEGVYMVGIKGQQQRKTAKFVVIK
jgi:hypothetical protein